MEKAIETTKYLYGASVQGIQNFIFQTNKLKEIVGASELVAQICTTAFEEFSNSNVTSKGLSIIQAAGNVRFLFDKKEDCQKAVLIFPQKVTRMAPGITISQAVVRITDSSKYAEQSDELEKLLRIQRNKVFRSATLGLMAIKRAPSTGLPAVEEKNGLLDEASIHKLNPNITAQLMTKIISDVDPKKIAYDIGDICEEGKNNWIAVIHADGNGLGNIVRTVCKNPNDAKAFSKTLDAITKESTRRAYSSVKDRFNSDKIPLRLVVMGGDDLTLICRADFAVEFTHAFLNAFEDESKKQFNRVKWSDENSSSVSRDGLTACAGIAFVKSSYPFHYAISLAENLCGEAKKKAKIIKPDLAPSCLMFHKVRDSFVEDFKEIRKRELTPQSNISFEYGPYYCNAQTGICGNTIGSLLGNIKNLEDEEGNKLKTHLRQWVSLLYNNVGLANQKMKRLRIMSEKAHDLIPEQYEQLSKTDKAIIQIPQYDILSLHSIKQTTKEKKNDENAEI